MRLAVIPARGGSKRIPRKNIRAFAGKPIIAYSIGVARESALFDRIVVSTDDRAIAEVAEQLGAEVPFMRPAELADDHTGTNDVVRHAIGHFRDTGEAVDHVCCIYATAPFLRADDLRSGFEQLADSNLQYAFSVTSFDFPVQRALRRTAEGGLQPVDPDAIGRRSQDLEELLHDAGQFYWGRADAFVDRLPLFAAHSIPIVLPRWRVHDIDTPEDWRRAELMFAALAAEEEQGSCG